MLEQSEFNGVIAANVFHVHAAFKCEWRERVAERVAVAAGTVAEALPYTARFKCEHPPSAVERLLRLLVVGIVQCRLPAARPILARVWDDSVIRSILESAWHFH